MSGSISLTVVVPALNEEKNIEEAIAGLTAALNSKGIEWEIILVNDGSTDLTPYIAADLAGEEPRIRVINHRRTMGIGRCFLDGIKASTKDAVTWFPGDGENDPDELIKYFHLLEYVDIVVPFVINKEVRGWSRRFVSRLYLWIVNLLFGTMFNYTTGNVIYRRNVFETITPKARGFTYQTECLVRAVRAGFTFAEVPVLLGKRAHGRSKILTFKSILKGIREIALLFVEVHISTKTRRRTHDKVKWKGTQRKACDETNYPGMREKY